MDTGQLHIPVMVREVVGALQVDRGGWFVDCTLGMGGHSRAMLEACPSVNVLGVDRDSDALKRATEALGDFPRRFRGVHADFKDVAAWRPALPEAPAGILADLGLSGYQLKAGRGFSFRDQESLDMRMDPGRGESVADFIETAGEDELAGVLKAFGEEPFAKRIARAVVSARDSAPIGDAATLAAIVAKAVPRKFHGKIHPATRTFQALRIHVNRELDNLHEFLEEVVGMMQAGGRIVVLAYHSLEDRIVKETFKTLARGCICPPKLPVCGCGRTASLRLVTRGAMRPEQAEVEANPASRSARMRAGEKL